MNNEVADFDIVNSFQRGIDRIFEYVPQIIGAIIILVIGYFVSVGLRKIVLKALRSIGFDGSIKSSAVGRYVNTVVDSPAALMARITFWIVWIGFISLALSVLDLQLINWFIAAVYGYLPNVIAAIIIFLIASALSAGAVSLVQRVMGDTPTAKLIKAVIPAVTLSIAVFMILNQLRIAPDIVNITYIAIVGSLSLGLALAFGLGGRDLAAKILEDAYQSGKKSVDQARSDMKHSKKNSSRSNN